MIVFIYLKKIKTYLGIVTYWMVAKNTKKVLNSDSGIWHLSSVGDEFYLPGEAALHTTTEIWTLRLFLGGRASFSH